MALEDLRFEDQFFVICGFVLSGFGIREPKLFADLKPPQVRKYILFLLTNKPNNALIKKTF